MKTAIVLLLALVGCGEAPTVREVEEAITPPCKTFVWTSFTMRPEANAVATLQPTGTQVADPTSDTLEVTPTVPPTAEFYRLDNGLYFPSFRFAEMIEATWTPPPLPFSQKPLNWPGIQSGCQRHLKSKLPTIGFYNYDGHQITVPAGTFRIFGTNLFDFAGDRVYVFSSSYQYDPPYYMTTVGTITKGGDHT